MEYSLSAILYLTNMQIELGTPANRIWNKDTESFCNLTKYKEEALEYLIKYNNSSLDKTLKNQLSICNSIITKWEGFIGCDSEDFNWLKYMGIDGIDKYNEHEYNRYGIYFLFTNEHHLFEEIKLLKEGRDSENREYIEMANSNVTSRDWEWDRAYRLDLFDKRLFPNLTSMKSMVRSSKDVRSFLEIHYGKSNNVGFK
ncbi:MAG: hypothetical protein LBL13_04665 [Bacteroidales bacterium]|nr:hypothetical protein [Bacteroidales bacterium]